MGPSALAADGALLAATKLFDQPVTVEVVLVGTLLAAVTLGAVFRLGRRLVETVTGGEEATDDEDDDVDDDGEDTPAVEAGPSYSVSYSPVPADERSGSSGSDGAGTDGDASGGAAAGDGGSQAAAGTDGGTADPAPSGPRTGEPAPSDGETGTDTRIFTGGWGGDDGVPDACPDCGEDLAGHDDVTFCPYCGHEL